MTEGRNEKETMLHLPNIRAGDHLQRNQTQKELHDLLCLKDYELGVLHQVNTRLGAQLSILQHQLGIDPQPLFAQLQHLNESLLPSTKQHLQYLQSLFSAYDEVVLRQKKTIAQLYAALDDSEKGAQALIKDNQHLLEQNQSKCKKILQIYQRGTPDDSLVPSYNRLQRQMQTELMDTLKQQNEYLTHQLESVAGKLVQTQEELTTALEAAEKYFNTVKINTEQLKNAAMKIDDLMKIKQILERKYQEAMQSNIQLDSNKQMQEVRVGKIQLENRSIKQQLLALKKSTREDLERMSLECDGFRVEAEGAMKREREAFTKAMSMEKEYEVARDTVRSQKRKLEKIKTDFEQTIKMCEAYEGKISSYVRREESLKVLAEENRKKVEEAVLERDKSQLKIEQLQKFIENVNNRHREEVNTLKCSYEKIVSAQQQSIRQSQQQRQEQEQMHSQNQSSSRHQVEKLKKEMAALREQNNKYILNMKNHSGSELISRLKELQQKNESLTKVLAQKERAYREEREHAEETIHNYQMQNRECSRLAERERSQSSALQREVAQLKSRVSIVTNEKECVESEISKLKKSVEGGSADEWVVRDLENKLAEAVQKERQTRNKAIEMLEKYDQAEEKLKNQYQSRIIQLQTEIAKMKNRQKSN